VQPAAKNFIWLVTGRSLPWEALFHDGLARSLDVALQRALALEESVLTGGEANAKRLRATSRAPFAPDDPRN
jgi:hypothetical protein